MARTLAGWGAKIQPQTVFLVLGLVFGTAFAVATPPFDAPDERRHLGRAYLISEGRLVPPGFAPGHEATLPVGLLSIHPRAEADVRCRHEPVQLFGQLGEGFDAETRARSMQLTTLFAPVAYVPQAAAIALGRSFGTSAAGLLYLARFANLVCWLALVAWAIRRCPVRRWALVALALTPMAVFLSASVTADAVMTAAALAFFAEVVRAAVSPRAAVGGRLSGGEQAGLVAGAVLVGLVKPGYWLLAALLLLIPVDRFGTQRRRSVFLVAAGVAVLLPSAIWIAVVAGVDPWSLGPEADPGAQVRGVLLAPWQFAWAMIETLALQWRPWIATFVGVLGRLDVPLPGLLYVVHPMVLAALCLADRPDAAPLQQGMRWGLLGLFLACCASVLAVAYASWNPVGARYVADVHGRYFLPLVPLAMLAAPPCWRMPDAAPVGIAGYGVATLSVALWMTVQRFYTG